jgi:hypothetical protein
MGGRVQVTAALAACALGMLAGCGGGAGGGRALPPPRAGSFEAFDGAGRSQHLRLRVGDTLTAAISDRGMRPCVGAGAGCVRFSFTGPALAPAGAPSASNTRCNDARHRCVYARAAFRTVRVGRDRVTVTTGRRVLMTVDVAVRAAPRGYAPARSTPTPATARAGLATESGPPPLGRYRCYQFDPVTGFSYAGAFTLVDGSTYTAETGGGGTYSATGDAVEFTDGPYADFTGKPGQDKQGNDVIALTLKSDPHVTENCDHTTS